jgi:hypothetical protein
MNEPKNSANSEPPDADEDDDDAATKLSELPSDLMFEDGNAPFGIIEPAAEDVEMVAPTPPPPRPASAPESVQIRALGPPALSGDDIDVHGDTRLLQVPNDPANAVANAANAASAANAGQGAGNPQASTQGPGQNPPPFGVYPPQQQQYAPPQQQQQPQPHQHQPQQQQPNPPGQQPYQPQQQQQGGQPGQYEPASPFAATAYANPTNAPNTQQLQGAGSQPQQRALAYAPTAPSPFVVGPPAPVAVQAKFAPPYAAPGGGGPASGIVWAIGGILVGLVLLGIIAFVLFWLLRGA